MFLTANITKGFTAKAKEAVLYAEAEALKLKNCTIATEHLLLGLLTVNDTLTDQIWRRFNIAPHMIRTEALRVAPVGTTKLNLSQPIQMVMMDEAYRVLMYARQEAGRFDKQSISTPYLLFGLLSEESGIAAQVLNRFSLRADELHEIISEIT